MTAKRPLTPQEYGEILRRRWLLIVSLALLGPLVGYGGSLLFHNQYKSKSLLLIESQRIPESYVKSLISEDLNMRVSNIEEHVLSRTQLQPIIERYGLFKDAAKRNSMEALVLMLEKAIEVTPLKPLVSSPGGTVPGFEIAVTLDDPRVAQQVCSDIASMFIEADIRQRSQTAQGTTSFLQGQLDDAKRSLDEKDAKLAAFKRKYMGMLPDDTQTNLNLLNTLDTQLGAATQAVNRASQDKAYTETVLAQQVQAWEITKALKPGSTLGTANEPDPLQKRLTDLENYLTNLQAQYTDDFPAVINTKAEIADLKKQISGAPSHSANASAPDKPKKDITIEPASIGQLRAQAHSYDEAIAVNTREQKRLQDQIKQYESRLQLSPVVEEEYKEVTRDYQTALQFYNDLLSKRDQSGMATDLERRQEGEQFRVVDPANLPEKPSFPNRPLFALGGLGLGLLLGVGIAMGAAMNDNRLRSELDLEFYLGVNAFSLIPSMASPKNGKRSPNGNSKRKLRTGATLALEASNAKPSNGARSVLMTDPVMGSTKGIPNTGDLDWEGSNLTELRVTLNERSPEGKWNPDPTTMVCFDKEFLTRGGEEFRTLRSRLNLIRERQPLQRLLVTSPMAGDGKSFIAANLAEVILWQGDRHVLLIDADLRSPRLHLSLGTSSTPGLTDYLSGEADEFAILKRGAQKNLFFIPSGKQVPNSSELLENGRLSVLLKRMSSIFDWIIIDSPPVVPIHDAKIIGDLCDGVLTVFNAGVTPFDLAQRAYKEFKGKAFLGVVFNQVNVESIHGYGYYQHQTKTGTNGVKG
ncbi:MAG: polysaccharide biosynthesis tyrosine autokinase [Terriglobia bacterium]